MNVLPAVLTKTSSLTEKRLSELSWNGVPSSLKPSETCSAIKALSTCHRYTAGFQESLLSYGLVLHHSICLYIWILRTEEQMSVMQGSNTEQLGWHQSDCVLLMGNGSIRAEQVWVIPQERKGGKKKRDREGRRKARNRLAHTEIFPLPGFPPFVHSPLSSPHAYISMEIWLNSKAVSNRSFAALFSSLAHLCPKFKTI